VKRPVARPTRLQPLDALGEAIASIVARPGRAVFVCFGTLVGTTWFVAVLGLVSTAAGQVATVFKARLATTVTVTPRGGSLPIPTYPYPSDVEQRLDALPGVIAAGVYWKLKIGKPIEVTAGTPTPGHSGQPGVSNPPVFAVSPGMLAAAQVSVTAGRLFGAWAQAHHLPLCLVGELAAKSLGVGRLRKRPTVYIDHVACVVIGIVGATARLPTSRSVLLPSSTAIALWGPPDDAAGAVPTIVIRTRPGAADVVAAQAPFAISPARPRRFAVSVPPGPIQLRNLVNGTLANLFVVLAWLGLIIGTLTIVTVSVMSVLHRGAEFGLRRAIGARRRHIAAQVLAESAMLALIGGLAGTSLGVTVVVIVAFARRWAPVIEPRTVLYAPLIAAAAGLLAGLLGSVPGAWMAPGRMLTTFPPE